MTQYPIAVHPISPAVSAPGPLRITPFVEGTFTHDEEGSRQWSEAPDQIREWCKYEYQLPYGYCFESHPVVEASPNEPWRGVICAKNYVGRLRIKYRSVNDDAYVGYVELESTTAKINYRNQYRLMLNEIAEGATKIYELLMDSSEFAFTQYKLDTNASAQTVYQRFAFLRSLLDGEDFKSALTRILTQPMRMMRAVEEEIRPSSVRRVTSSIARQLAKGGVVCRWVNVQSREETSDTIENRFVKQVLKLFSDCVTEIGRHSNASDVLRKEADRLGEEITYWLSSSVMRETSDVSEIGIPSVAMQRRDGYRDVLKSWLMFDFSSSLQWDGGNDVYSAGNKDVAQLYEYWAFFKLLDIVGSEFQLEPKDVRDLLVPGKNGIDLMLKKGTTKIVQGVSGRLSGNRPLMVEFTYNKQFKAGAAGGSWTVDMIPDYTLTLWPADAKDKEFAVKNDLLVHVHFDAKYRIENYSQIFKASTDAEEMDTVRTYPRDTLLKMHAYNDAVKKTYGSYVLYPGEESTPPKRRYHEILPGVGAFVLRPDKKDEELDCVEIRKFIHDIRISLEDRMSQRERVAAYRGMVHSHEPVQSELRGILLPEKTYDGRPFIPAEQYCLIGFLRENDRRHDWRGWVEKNGYNLRFDAGRGEFILTPEVLNAEYILLHDDDIGSGVMYRIDKYAGLRIAKKEELLKRGYPGVPSRDHYLMVPIKILSDDDPMKNLVFDITKLGRKDTHVPFSVSIEDLVLKAYIENSL